MRTRWRERERERTNLDSAGTHVELCGELFAERSIWFCVLAEDLFEDLELRSRCSLAVLDFVGDVGEEGPEIDRGGVDTGGHQSRNASVLVPWERRRWRTCVHLGGVLVEGGQRRGKEERAGERKGRVHDMQ